MEPGAESDAQIQQVPRVPEWEQMLERFQSSVIAGKAEQAEALAMELLVRATEWAEANPSADQHLRMRGEWCEENGDRPGAEAARRDILELALQDRHPGFATKAHWELGIHFITRNLIE